MLKFIPLVLLACSYLLVRMNIPHLPACIPTHFNAAGVANGSGSPDTLWTLVWAQALCCAMFLIIPSIGRAFPGVVHFGRRRLSDFPPAQRARMLPMLSDMSAYLSIVMNLFLSWMVREMVRLAQQPQPRLHMIVPMALLIGGMAGVTLYYLVLFGRAATGTSDSSPTDASE